ncbi:MOB-like protein phocein isoform X5 [Dermacentor albipictus]|uniref:MOB-like protein phocein isoform X5 n=1 Tax=Dermacentor albipictus TaxID=60249 RepID=UPI0031FD69DE
MRRLSYCKHSAGTRYEERVLRFATLAAYTKNFSSWPDEPFDEMDSTLAVQQFIQQAIRKDPANVDEILTPPDGQDEGVWKYEHLRQFCMELNGLAVKLQVCEAECNADSCTQMTATEQWIFLCAAHKTPKECPAIDYTRHTLDGAACLLNSNKYFPSRHCSQHCHQFFIFTTGLPIGLVFSKTLLGLSSSLLLNSNAAQDVHSARKVSLPSPR